MMFRNKIVPWMLLTLAALTACGESHKESQKQDRTHALELDPKGFFRGEGVEVLAFNNAPGGLFFDAKTSGVEVIQRGERLATNGDLRLLRTPEQWDGMAELKDRRILPEEGAVETRLEYTQHDFSYRIQTRSEGESVFLSVHLDEPLPEGLVGKAGLNMEFLPAAYFHKTYLMDDRSGLLPRKPTGPMETFSSGLTQPKAMATGHRLVLAPEDPDKRISVRSLNENSQLMLFDGRTKAQNGWYVVRSLIPDGVQGKVLEWELTVQQKPGWLREPVMGYSQVGYHPHQQKVAVLELDPKDQPPEQARLVPINGEEAGKSQQELSAPLEPWGEYLRYRYYTFDFSAATEPGLYEIHYGDRKAGPVQISADVHANTWQPTLDTFFPVQMDHMRVREAYRVWHGASHLDDALQAPPNYQHFDLFAHGAETDTDFETFEHIPGLDIGGWYDAGDYDIRTQSQYATVLTMVHAWEEFGIDRDNTTVSQDKRYVELHRPDGKPDLLQQIEHGTLALVAQHRAVGHAIPGIVAGHLYQYPHLGDGSTKTDNLVYDPALDPRSEERHPGEMYLPSTDAPAPEQRVMNQEGNRSGRFDDRWAFTTNTSALNYGSAAALAAASRALGGYNDELAQESLETAQRVWDYEQNREPNLYRHGNTTGGRLEEERLKAAVELLLSTRENRYSKAVWELLPEVKERFAGNAFMLAAAMPHMNHDYTLELEKLAQAYREDIKRHEQENPYGVPITRGGWAGNGTVARFGLTNYALYKVFPDIIEPELVLRSLNYLFGTHPNSNISFVSGVGAHSKEVAYGMNRADFSFIAGGVVPGVLILEPDYPENKENWPFFWGENEYVIPLGASYLYLAKAAQRVLDMESREEP